MQLIPGKRYRVIVEGTASPDGLRVNLDGDAALYVGDFDLATIELLPDPLPTTPGSIVRRGAQSTFVRLKADGTHPWTRVGTFAGQSSYSDEDLKSATVLYDAGAERA